MGSNDLGILRIFYPRKADEVRNSMKSESSDLKLRIKEISYFQNQQKFKPKLGEMEEENDFKQKISFLNLIQTQVTVG